jgi:hypothetical protein
MLRLRFPMTAGLFACFALSDGAAQTAEPPKTQPDVPPQYAATAFGQAGSVAGEVLASRFMDRN